MDKVEALLWSAFEVDWAKLSYSMVIADRWKDIGLVVGIFVWCLINPVAKIRFYSVFRAGRNLLG